MASQQSRNELFNENLAHDEPVDINGDGEEAEEEESNVVEGIIIGNRKANDYDKRTKRTIAWQEGELSIIIDLY